ncbi:histone deacetylase family protein [Aquicoccus sp. SCR17]|nr:histone deacetylase family protein [Carideicomes alvinocaridis]
MITVYSDAHRRHAPETIAIRGMIVGNLELPARADALVQAARQAGCDIRPPDAHDDAPLLAVHSQDYIDFLASAYDRWKEAFGEDRAGPYACAHASPTRYPARVPASIQAQVGYYLSGGSAPIDKGTWVAARDAAHCALTAAEHVLDGAGEAYAICRPPGHHAYADLAGGFCYLNNSAIAAQAMAAREGRTAILDIDVHHGNGTQDIFYDRGDVFFASIHADPNEVFPFYVGYADETGEGEGEGANLNLPLPRRSGDDVFLDALDTALAGIADFAPPSLVLSLGFDAYENDPQQEMAVSTEGFREAARRIAALRLPTAIIQEGGYCVDDLGKNLTAFLEGFDKGR